MLNRCSSYIDKFLSFSKKCFDLPLNPNRVILKRSILDATIGLPIEPFIKWLDESGKKNLMNCVSSECPVTCFSRKKMYFQTHIGNIPPIESSPLKIIQSCKKLRHYLMIPESQACRGCVKRSRCKNFLQIEQGVPDLSDVARMVLGMNTMCNLYIENSELLQEEDGSVSNICYFFSLLDSLEHYLLIIKERNGSLKVQRGDDRECTIEASKQMKKQIICKLQERLSKMYNIPSNMYNFIRPRPKTKLTKSQRILQDKLDRLTGNNKTEEDNRFVWIPEPENDDDETKCDENVQYQLKFENNTKIIQLDTLKNEEVEFRLMRDSTNSLSEEIKHYDIKRDNVICYIKNEDSTILNLNDSASQNYKNYVNRYTGKRLKKLTQLTQILEYYDPNMAKKALSNVIKVPFETPSQSSGNSIPPMINKRNNIGSDYISTESLDNQES